EPFYDGQINLAWQFPPGTNPPPPPPPPEPRCHKVPPPPGCEVDSPEHLVEGLLGPKLSDDQKASIAAALKQPRRGPARSLGKDAIHIGELPHLPPPPASRPTTSVVFDQKGAKRAELQRDLLCS